MYTPTLSYAQGGLKPSIKSSDKAQEQAKEKEKKKGATPAMPATLAIPAPGTPGAIPATPADPAIPPEKPVCPRENAGKHFRNHIGKGVMQRKERRNVLITVLSNSGYYHGVCRE